MPKFVFMEIIISFLSIFFVIIVHPGLDWLLSNVFTGPYLLENLIIFSSSSRELSWNPVDFCFSVDGSLSKPARLLISHPRTPLRFSLMFHLLFPGSVDASILDICLHFVGAIKKWIGDKFLKPCVSEKMSLFYLFPLFWKLSEA